MKKEAEKGPATGNLTPNAVGIGAGGDTNGVIIVWYVKPMFMRNGPASHWSI